MSESQFTLRDVQQLIRRMYGAKDEARGIPGTFMWLMEEMGELASELGKPGADRSPESDLAKEFADVLAWLVTIANTAGVDLDAAFHAKYGGGCPGCGAMVCQCGRAGKP